MGMANNSLKLVKDFLVQHEQLPAYKDEDAYAEQIQNIQDRLTNKLSQLNDDLEDEFISELQRRGKIPGSDKKLEEFLDQILSAPLDEMQQEVADGSVEGAKAGREITVERIIEQGMEISFEAFDEDVIEALRKRRYKFSEDTFNRIRGDFKKTLTEGYKGGLGIDDIAENLRGDFENMRGHRLRTIARTEVESAQEEGAQQTMEDYEVEYKQWITAQDDRVRDLHTDLHGEVVKRDEYFSNDLKHPGDQSGPPEQVINCRCRSVPYIPGRGEHITTTPYYP